MRTIQQFLVVVVVYPLLSVPGFGQTGTTVDICERTPQVEAGILAAITPTPDCDVVPVAGLEGITSLSLAVAGINSLASGDFTGLSGLVTLNLSLNALTTLPPDVFDGLSALETLILNGTSLTTLPNGVFDSLTALEELGFSRNRLTTLPDGIFDRLTELERLSLGENSLTTLPDGVFDGLSALEQLGLGDNELTTLPDGVFDGLSVLERLDLRNNNFTALTGLPVGVFDDVLDTLGTIGALESFRVDMRVRNAHFVCSRPDAETIVAATAGVNDCLRITTTQLAAALPNANLSALTISAGTLTPEFDRTTLTYSATVPNTVATLTITPTAAGSGATVAGTVNAGAAMTTTPFTAALDVGENEIAVIVTAADSSTLTYRLTVTREPPPSVNICGRTPEVRDAILAAISDPPPACETVPVADLAGITALNFLFGSVPSLANGDFSGLSGLEMLDLRGNDFPTLPADVFDGLEALVTLFLGSQRLNPLPADVFDGLEALVTLSLITSNLTTLPDGVFDDLSMLENLDLRSNDFTTLPAGVFDGLSMLETLNLRSNDFTTLPAGVFNRLSMLETLNLRGNDFTTLPADVFDGLEALVTLNLNDNEFTTLPNGVFNGLSMLENLDLRFNDDLTTLPDGVLDDVLDTLGTIGEDLSASFRVDDNVRNAHFVCSRANADTIVANTPDVDDCLRITSAQLAVALANADLSALTISAGTLTPEFDSATLTYSATVLNAVATLTITPTTADSGATVAVTVNGGAAMTTAPFTAALNEGENEIEVVVTAADSSTQTYGLTVIRAILLDLNQDQTVNAQDAQILYYLSLTPRPDNLLNTLLGNAENIAALEAGAAALAGADRFDLVDDNVLDQNDWRLLYYALRFEDELSASPALQDALGVTQATLDAVRLLIE